MQKFTNPLDNIKIASPCSANWNEMFGDDRKRHCAECKLNVYNLSNMTQREAENFLINSEGRVCLRVVRRQDGTVLTQDCPVGWQAVKKRVSRLSTAAFALVLGFFGGIFSFESLKPFRSPVSYEKVPEPFPKTENKKSFNEPDEVIILDGMLNNLPEIKVEIFKSRSKF